MSKAQETRPEFKWEAIELVRRSGTNCQQVALEQDGTSQRAHSGIVLSKYG
ncbi:hypothetical protein SAMN05216504_3586 [Pseudomonas sp. A214]|nr:hypothetical protein SAMN05216504_3586 [Pseudomonas sp. A214]